MSSNSLSPEIAATLLELDRRVKHADQHPVVEDAANGDQNPITVWHSEMLPLLNVAPFTGPEWDYMREQQKMQRRTISGQYPCAWIRAMVDAVKGE